MAQLVRHRLSPCWLGLQRTAHPPERLLCCWPAWRGFELRQVACPPYLPYSICPRPAAPAQPSPARPRLSASLRLANCRLKPFVFHVSHFFPSRVAGRNSWHRPAHDQLLARVHPIDFSCRALSQPILRRWAIGNGMHRLSRRSDPSGMGAIDFRYRYHGTPRFPATVWPTPSSHDELAISVRIRERLSFWPQKEGRWGQ